MLVRMLIGPRAGEEVDMLYLDAMAAARNRTAEIIGQTHLMRPPQPAAVIPAPKRGRGWPKGRPRGPRKPKDASHGSA